MRASRLDERSGSVREPGIHQECLRVDLGDGEGSITIPYFILQGREVGPTLFVAAGEHGNELNGVASIFSFVREFDPARFGGAIIAVPVVTPPNPPYRHHTKGQPRGEGYTNAMPYNTWKRWPGRPDGDPADRISHAIASQLLPGVAAVLNFHAWGRTSATAAIPGGNPGVSDEIPLGRQLGVPFFLYESDEAPFRPTGDRLSAYASHVLGVPGYLIELRTQWHIRQASAACGSRAIRNACRYFGILDGEMEDCPGGQFSLRDPKEIILRAPSEGLYVPIARIESPVREGELLGQLHDLTTGDALPVSSPVDGWLWLNHRIGPKADVILEDQSGYADKGDILVIVKHT